MPGEEPFHIPSLDGVRGVSFLVVFLAHGGLGRYVPGFLGLDLFFFLSGYLITTLMRLEYDRTGRISLKQFYLRRALRILPPFYLVLALVAALTAAGRLDGMMTPAGVAAQVLHLTNYSIVWRGWWNGLAPGTWVYWSLAVEEHFYLGFPLLYLWMRPRLPSGKAQAGALLSLCALVLLWRCALVFVLQAPKDRVYVATDTRIDSILFGCVLALWHNPALDRFSLSDRAVALLLLPGLLLLAGSLVIPGQNFQQTARYTLQGLGLLPMFLAAIRWHDRGIFRVLATPPLRYLGTLSYSLYLMHTAALQAFQQWTPWPEWARSCVVLALIIILAAAIHHFVELPAARLRRHLARRLSPA